MGIVHPVVAGFSASPTSGAAPLTVTFSNLSSGDFTTSLWNFGDGATSTLAAPTHMYSLPGEYTVTLTVSGAGGSDTLVRASYIHAFGLKVSGRATVLGEQGWIARCGYRPDGDHNYSASTNATGVFTISNILVGSYSLVPEKEDDANGITAYDAALVLQHVAGLSSLIGYPAIAADVNNSGSIGTMDASYILQKAVGLISLPFPGAVSVWEFDPPNRSYVALNTDKSGQDFTGILLGDPSGSWQAGGMHPEARVQGTQAKLSFQVGLPDPAGQVTATILLDTAGFPITSMDLKVDYDPNYAQIVSTEQGSLIAGWMFAENVQQPGEIWVGLAGSYPVSNQGIVLSLVFEIEDLSGGSPLHFTEGLLNEGLVPVELEDGRLGGMRLFLPLVENFQ